MNASLHPLHLRRLVGRTLTDAERDLVKVLSALPAFVTEVERRAQAAFGGLPGLSWDETRTRVEERLSRPRK